MQLDPRILQALLNSTPTRNANGQYQEYIDPTTGLPYSLSRNYARSGGDAETIDYSTLLPGEIVAGTGQKNDLGYNLQHVYDQQGNFVREDDDGAGFGAFGDFVGDNMGAILAAIATMGVASAAGGTLGAAGTAGAEAGAGGWADWAASELAGAAANPATAAQLNAWAAGSALPYAGASGLAGGAAAGGSATGGTNWADFAANEVAGASTNPATASQLNAWAAGSSLPFAGQSGLMSQATQAATNSTQKGLLDKVTEWASNPSNLGRLGLAAAAAADSKDRQQVTQQEPWGPAQPLLKSLIGDTADLWAKYRDQPMSELQRQAYGNQFGLLNAMNGMVPGLLSGMNANSSGANNYDRTNPRRSLVGNTARLQWTPGLLNLPPKG